jgi:uncharacterized protein YlzI (FlbEa/FlbD family)
MSDRLIDRYTKSPATNGTADDSGLEPEDLGCFGWLRGVRDRAIMLELRKKDGHVLAIGYGWIERIELVPEAGITLYLPGRKVYIKGSSLNSESHISARLFDGLIRHRVPWVRESDHSELIQQESSDVVIESIAWDE